MDRARRSKTLASKVQAAFSVALAASSFGYMRRTGSSRTLRLSSSTFEMLRRGLKSSILGYPTATRPSEASQARSPALPSRILTAGRSHLPIAALSAVTLIEQEAKLERLNWASAAIHGASPQSVEDKIR
jgi:hypothetical protein